MIPVEKIILEGPDLSGKTTLFNRLHQATNFKWNIQDRSALSMLVYAKLYNRDQFHYVESLNKELNNLNNQMIILLPEWNVIIKRFNQRGDELHNFTSLKKLYSLFNEAADDLERLPNVTVIKKEVDDFMIDSIVSGYESFESSHFTEMSSRCLMSAATGRNLEKIGLTFTAYNSGSLSDIDGEALLYEKEKAYYDGILKSVLRKISDELSGINEYTRVENTESRRFIYTSDTCISLAHFMLRGNILNAKYFLRSSNTRDTLKYDLNFLNYLAARVKESLKLDKSIVIKLEVLVNSAHVPSNIDEN